VSDFARLPGTSQKGKNGLLQDNNDIMNEKNEIPIILDHKEYKVPPGTITGLQLRALPTPHLGTDVDVWEVVPGGDDIKIGDNQPVAIKPGMHFYSAPRTINPGMA